jgi:hypothetical protein
MILFWAEVEMQPPDNASPQTVNHCIDKLIEGLNISSGTFCTNQYDLIRGGFIVEAISHRQAVWRALDMIANAARAAAIPPEPVAFGIERQSTLEMRTRDQDLIDCSCRCHDPDVLANSSG